MFGLRVGEQGAPVVFLHGLFGQGRNFTSVAKVLQPAYRSVLVDLPNHGRSPWTNHVSYEEMADEVASFIRDELPGQRPHVVGHSMGGKVAMTLALRHPEVVERLVVVDISPVRSAGVGEFDHLLTSLAALDLTAVTRRDDADRVLAEPIRSRSVRDFLLQNLRRRDGGWEWQANLALLHGSLDVIGDFPRFDDETFPRPTLWVAGSESDYVQREHAPEMRRLFPRTRLVTIRGAGHWVHSQRPDEFVATLRAFLAADG